MPGGIILGDMSPELAPAGRSEPAVPASPPSVQASPDDVRRAQAGDVDAFERIYRAYVGRVFALCLRLSGDRSAAEQLTQDTFVAAWERLSSFRGDAAITSWLHRIAVNTYLMETRGTKRYDARIITDDALTLDAVTLPRDVEQAIDLEQAIAALPPGARTVFVLHDIEGYRHEEIARMTGLAAGTLRAQLHRARQLLMKSLSR
jgi:RNA polymerase sigma-70 factor (ECF subfamily)